MNFYCTNDINNKTTHTESGIDYMFKTLFINMLMGGCNDYSIIIAKA